MGPARVPPAGGGPSLRVTSCPREHSAPHATDVWCVLQEARSVCHIFDVPKPSCSGHQPLSLTTPPVKIKSRLFRGCKALVSVTYARFCESLTHFFPEQTAPLRVTGETILCVSSTWILSLVEKSHMLSNAPSPVHVRRCPPGKLLLLSQPPSCTVGSFRVGLYRSGHRLCFPSAQQGAWGKLR